MKLHNFKSTPKYWWIKF